MVTKEEENETSYHDSLIDVNNEVLTIQKYNFPIFDKRIVKINNIKNIFMIEMNRGNGKYTFFGFCWKLYWYHLDRKRPLKTHAIIIQEENNNIKIGITPDDCQKCFKVLNNVINKNKDCELKSLK